MRVLILAALLALTACSASVVSEPKSAQVANSPAGKIIDLHSGQTLSAEQLLQQLAQQPRVIVGEKHDNLQHHQIEQWLVQQLPSQRPQGSVLMEMLTPNQQAKVDSSKLWLQQNPQAQPEQVAQRLEWQKGWPWAQYQGVVMAAMHGAYPLWSANLDRAEIMAFYQNPVLPAGKASQQPQALQAISDTIRTSHGGEIAPAQLKAMLAIQQQRDHRMAQRLLAAPTPALLIAGAFHALKDTSVPLHMADLDNGKLPTVLILAEAGTTVSASQADYVWYTVAPEGAK